MLSFMYKALDKMKRKEKKSSAENWEILISVDQLLEY